MSTMTYRFDIDGTIAEPKFFDDDLLKCMQMYLDAGIISQDDVKDFKYHQQVFLLPHVLVTHQPIQGAVEVIQELHLQGRTLQYFTVRQAFDPEQCAKVHSNTRFWLEQCHFACPSDVHFFWDASEKLKQSLEAEEDRVILIDDRPAGLITAYQKIATTDPDIAQQIRKRITLVAFGYSDTSEFIATDLEVVPLLDWSQFHMMD